MVGQVAQVHQLETYFLCCLLQPCRILGSREIVVNGVCMRHIEFRRHYSLRSLQCRINTVLHRRYNVQLLHQFIRVWLSKIVKIERNNKFQSIKIQAAL